MVVFRSMNQYHEGTLEFQNGGYQHDIGGMLAILFYVVLYNRMMAYVESRAYRAAPAPENKTEST